MGNPLFRLVIPRVPYPNVFSHLVMPPLGAIYVATAIKAAGGWDVEVIDELNWSGASARKLREDPVADHRDLQARRPATAVGFYGGLTSTIPRLLQVAKFYRDLGIHTVAGGAHVDALPDEPLANGIEIVVHGEGEETILDILRAWNNNIPLSGVDGISYIDLGGAVRRTKDRHPIHDLNLLPTPDFSLMKEMKRSLRVVPIERTRGCNYQCEFCIVNDRFGPSRSASPERVAAEVEQRVKEGYHTFFCVDDNFTQGREGIMKLLELLTDIRRRLHVKLDFTVQVRSSVGRDPELMRAMRLAGVSLLAIGLESPIGEELKSMAKHQTPEQIERDIRALRKNGFMIHGMFIFGYPMENTDALPEMSLRERADRFYNFIKSSALDTIQVLKPVPVPGSKLAERLRAQGRIYPLNMVGWDKYDGNFLCFQPDKDSAREFQVQATRILRRFYSPMNFFKLPVLAIVTPWDILRNGFRRASELAHDPVLRQQVTQNALSESRRIPSNLRAGFRESIADTERLWRRAIFRTLGSVIIANWERSLNHEQFLNVLQTLQSKISRRDMKTTS